MLNNIIAQSPKEIDLTNERHSRLILEAVEAILQEGYSLHKIQEIEDKLISRNDSSLIFILLALKIAKSKILVSKINEPLFVTVVFAVYKEHNRIKKSSEHEHGEDFLRRKINQMEWLFGTNPKIKWELVVVDDGCPEGSGKIAQQIIDEDKLHKKARVLFLADAIKNKYPPTRTLTSTKESQKGGSIIYGMWNAVQAHKINDHIVVFTDADLSTHLGQLMLLIDPILNNGKLVAIGSRREPTSVVIKKGTRNNRGKLFIYLWKRLIPNIGNIVDTQCGFKAFKSDVVPIIIEDMIERKFAFDIELLLRTELQQSGSIAKVPVAWIDSEAASTTTDLQPYLPMLKAIVKMNRKYFPDNESANEFADFIDSLDENSFNRLLNNIPENIVKRNPIEFGEYDKVRVDDLVLK